MSIDWSLIGQPVDIGARFQAGYDRGQQARKERQIDGALAALVQDPSNVEAQNALAGLDRGYASNLIEQREQAAHKQQIGRILTNPDFNAARGQAREMGDVDLLKQIDGLEAGRKKQLADMYKAAAPVAYQALKLPYEQRRQYIESVRPELTANGWSDDQINQFDPTDEGLTALVHSNMTLEQAMGRDEIKWHQAGEQPSFATDATGRPIGSQNPYAQGKLAGGQSPDAVGSVLSSAGLPAPVVAGFLGNFDVEGGYGGAKGDGGTAHGIAQWRADRQTNFQRVIGKPVAEATPEEQAQFVVWEMQNPEAAGMTVEQRDAILAAKTPGEAAALIDKHYERSSGQHRSRRVAAAERVGGPVRVASKEAFNALPSGTRFIAPDGSERIKP